MNVTSIDIPIIDFQPFINGNADEKKAVAKQIYDACHKIGFMYLKNLGVSSKLRSKMFHLSQHFFNLPQSVKNQIPWDELSNRGYAAIARERLTENKPGDLKEAFNLGMEDVDLEERSSSELAKENLFKRTNKWPPGEDTFRSSTLEFYQAGIEAADRLCHAFAIALNLPESFFLEKHNLYHHTLRLLHYPPIEISPQPEQQRAGEHSDYGSFTLLFQDNIGGLEVKDAAGKWIAAPPIPDTVVVNIGDLMQRWTNNVFCSTKHRVRIPNDDRIRRSRYSIALFCHPNDNTQVSCLETCHSWEHPPLYAPISAGDYLLSRLQATN